MAPRVSAPPPVFDLTGRTGSLMYMSPEVFKALPYNEKAGLGFRGIFV